MFVVLMGTLVLHLSGYLCSFLILTVLIKFLNKIWWNPIRIRSAMRSQGIKGPSYKLLHGNTKEIINMKSRITSNSMILSHELLPRVHPHLYSWIKLYGKNFLTWHGPQAQLVVTEPELIKEILMNKEGVFPKIEQPVYVKKLLGDGLATTESEKRSKLRKLSNHAFNAEILKGMIPAMVASVEMMLERWKRHEGKEIDVFQEFRVLTSEVISRTAFGSSYLEGQQIFSMLTKLGLIITRNTYNIRFPGLGKFVRTADDIESDKLEQGIRSSIISMIKKRENAAVKGGSDGFGTDFLGLLLKAHHNADMTKKLSVDDVIDECKTFYVAGQETTANSLTWTVFLLAIHTDWQDRARQEVVDLFGGEIPNSDTISRLKTMSMIVNESLRLYPPVLILARTVKSDVRLGKLALPKNMELNVPTLAVHQNPEIWGKDCDHFRPERFSEGVAKATNNNSAVFLPFGLGPRSCVGTNFSTTETKIALSMILRRYRMILSPNYVHSPALFLTLNPQHGLQIILQPL